VLSPAPLMQDGETPLTVLCRKKDGIFVCKMLLQAGADANKSYNDVRGHEPTADFVLNLLVFHFGDIHVHTEIIRGSNIVNAMSCSLRAMHVVICAYAARHGGILIYSHHGLPKTLALLTRAQDSSAGKIYNLTD
jgi:hypothetical protein